MIKAIDDGAKGYLLDAFPLNLDQAKEFEEFIGTPSKIIYLSISEVSLSSKPLSLQELLLSTIEPTNNQAY